MSETYKLLSDKDNVRRELRIVQDEDALNPRLDFDPLGTMVCKHPRYLLGDNHHFVDGDEIVKAVQKIIEDGGVVIKCYLMDHGGISMSTTPFSCPWDSGQVGFIWISAKRMKDDYGELNDAVRETVAAVLESEVKTYDQYLRGDCYGFELVEYTTCRCCEEEKEEVVDSCWGFYGTDIEENGILHHLDAADKAAIRAEL